jgi:biotin synthase-related radical SAM superfamily protein
MTDEAQMTPERKKATLLIRGLVKIPPDMVLPFKPSCSTAGPGAGVTAIVLAFEGMRVKKGISREKGDFELVPHGDKFSLLFEGRPFIKEVEIKPTVFHAPDQAFFNLDSRCIYGCKFCTSPLLEKDKTKGLTPDEVADMIIAAHPKEGFDAVAITSAVPDTPEETVARIIHVVKRVRKALPQMTIGVEPYVSSLDQIDRLKQAGADEIKMNIETFDRTIFQKVCGEKDYDWILRALERSVKVFGRGKVTSNIIIGLGESDENVIEGLEHMSRIGCVVTLRPLRLNKMNTSPLTEALGPIEPITEDRILRLAKLQKEILARNGLSALSFKTMCQRCGCCDIVPFVDI